jgi:flavodoxin
MKSLIICFSYHNMNTKKVANKMAGVLNCDIIQPGEVKNIDYDLIGLGSGIYDYKHHPLLLNLVDKLDFSGKKVFIFSTAGMPLKKQHKDLREKLEKKGAIIIGEFLCKGFNKNNERKGNTWFENRCLDILQLIGGMNKGHPSEKELIDAEKFVDEMKGKL